MSINEKTSLSLVVPSVWQKSNDRGKEHEEAHTSEGKGYPVRQTETHSLKKLLSLKALQQTWHICEMLNKSYQHI